MIARANFYLQILIVSDRLTIYNFSFMSTDVFDLYVQQSLEKLESL